MKQGLYANMNARKKAGTSRPKSESTIDPSTYRKMKEKRGGFGQRDIIKAYAARLLK